MLTKNTVASTWSTGIFPRDTLVYALGTMGGAIAERALQDSAIEARWQTWLARAAADSRLTDSAETLVCTGLGDGSVVLLARDVRDEFVVHCEHPAFEAVVAMGYDERRRRVGDVWVASFRGSMTAAIQFATAMTEQLRTHRLENWLQRCDPSPN